MSWVLNLPQGAGHQPDGSFILPLERPIDREDEGKVERLTFREAKGADYLGLPAGDQMFAQARFGCRLCGITDGEFRDMRGRDASHFLEVAGAFFGGAPEAIGSGPLGS